MELAVNFSRISTLIIISINKGKTPISFAIIFKSNQMYLEPSVITQRAINFNPYLQSFVRSLSNQLPSSKSVLIAQRKCPTRNALIPRIMVRWLPQQKVSLGNERCVYGYCCFTASPTVRRYADVDVGVREHIRVFRSKIKENQLRCVCVCVVLTLTMIPYSQYDPELLGVYVWVLLFASMLIFLFAFCFLRAVCCGN